MLIDWFTVVAQAINFLILVWLLKRFLYKPILHAIDEREKGIAAQLAEAEAKQAEAQKERDDFQNKNEAFEQEHAALLKKATDEASAERQRLLDEARKDADALRAKRQEALRNEYRNLSREIARWTQKEVFAIARKTLADLAAHEPRRAHGRRLRPAAAGDGLARRRSSWPTALKASTQPVRVRSAFDLPPAQRERDRRCGQANFRRGSSTSVRDRAGAGQRHRTFGQRTKDGLEHRGLSRDSGKERRRTSARGSEPESKPRRKSQAHGRAGQSRSQARAEA